MKNKESNTVIVIVIITAIVLFLSTIILALSLFNIISLKSINSLFLGNKEENPNITVIKGDGNSIGDIIEIGTEQFYVISSNYKETTMIAKYNLSFEISDNKTFEINDLIIQSSSAIGARNDNISESEYTINYSLYNANYDDSIVKIIVDKYVKSLEESYNIKLKGRLIKLEELNNLGIFSYGRNPDSKYGWLTSTTYWTQTSAGSGNVWTMFEGDGMVFYDHFSEDKFYGIRPVIVINNKYID